MTQFSQWLTMGGYAGYVWPAYGLFSLVLIFNLVGIKWQGIRTRKKLKQWYKQQ